jgi:anti-sigma factor RsiW
VSTEHVQEEALHMHFDGELAPAEAASVQRHLATCGECTKRLTSLQRLREMIAMSAEQVASEVDFDAMFGRVEQGTKVAPAPSLLDRLQIFVTESLEHNPMKVWAPVGGFAIAAAVLVFVLTRSGGALSDPEQQEIAKPGIVDEQRERKREKMMIASNASASNASEVVQVDFGSNTGTVFEIALADGASTPVVWINED